MYIIKFRILNLKCYYISLIKYENDFESNVLLSSFKILKWLC